MRFCIFCILFFLSAAAFGQEKGWTDLFNGKDLSHWKVLGGKARFDVVNGEIVGKPVDGEPNSFLTTENTYGDFILELEFLVNNMNSGIQFRSESTPDYMNGRVHGYQFEIDPSARAWTGGIYDEARRMWLYPLEYNPGAKSAFIPGSWNKVRLECIGNTMRTFLNDRPAAHLIDDMTPRGFIALQVHAIHGPEEAAGGVRFRNIRIRTANLTPTPNDNIFVANLIPNNLTAQEKTNGVQLLWDGKSTAGWRGANKDAFPDHGWKVADGTISVLGAGGEESANGGDIVTEDEFSFFDLQFEFKLTEGANSGVKYFVTGTEGNKGSAIGLEYQVLDDERHPDAKMGVVGNRTLASLYDLIPAEKVSRGQHEIGEWNYGRIVVYPNNHVEHWLNGYKVVEYDRGSPIYKALVARSKYAKWDNFGMADKGHILLQDHGNAVSFRSIKIRQLK